MTATAWVGLVDEITPIFRDRRKLTATMARRFPTSRVTLRVAGHLIEWDPWAALKIT